MASQIYKIASRLLWFCYKWEMGNHYSGYLDACKKVASGQKITVLKYRVIILCLMVQPFHQAYLARNSPLTDDGQILHYDAPYIVLQNKFMNVVWVPISILTAIYCYEFYFNFSLEVNQLLDDMLITDRCRQFVSPQYTKWSLITLRCTSTKMLSDELWLFCSSDHHDSTSQIKEINQMPRLGDVVPGTCQNRPFGPFMGVACSAPFW